MGIFLRLLGAFYVFAGYIGSRATLPGMGIDQAIAAIGAQTPPRAQLVRGIWLLAVTILVLLSGAALLLLLKFASYLFVANVALQGIYFFVLAPRLDRSDEPDPVGRRQSLNAFILYTLVTAIVIFAHSWGYLVDAQTVPVWVAAGATGLVSAYVGYVLYQFIKILGSPRGVDNGPIDPL